MSSKQLKKSIRTLILLTICCSGAIWAINNISSQNNSDANTDVNTDVNVKNLNISKLEVGTTDFNTFISADNEALNVNSMDNIDNKDNADSLKNSIKNSINGTINDSINGSINDHINNETIINSLVIETDLNETLPRNFRATHIIPENDKITHIPDLTGFKELNAAASAQFSETSLLNALKRIDDTRINSSRTNGTRINGTTGKIIVVDLRNEFHAFVNGRPVSFYYGRENKLNWNKTPEEILEFERKLYEDFTKRKEIKIHKLKKFTDYVEYHNPESILIERVELEKDLLKKHGLEYKRFYVTDHNKPADGQVDAFIAFVKNLPADSYLYFHCRGGRGRTTTFMTMFDIIRNARNVTFEDIIQRQHLIGGSLLSELPAVGSYKREYHRRRLEFIKKFYQYVVDPSRSDNITWSSWRALQDN